MQSSLIIPSHLLESTTEEAIKAQQRRQYIIHNRDIQSALLLGYSHLTRFYLSQQECLDFQAAGYQVEYSNSNRHATIHLPKVECIDALPLSDEDMSKGILPATALAPLSTCAMAASRLNTSLQDAKRFGRTTVHLAGMYSFVISLDDKKRFYDMISFAGYSVDPEQNTLSLQ